MALSQSANQPTYIIASHETAQVVELLDRYMNHKAGYPRGSEAFWYFEPWRASRSLPKESRVYATMHWTHHGRYYGFSYFVAEHQYWLMSYSTVAGAQGAADAFFAALKANDPRAMGVYSSAHQNKMWSEAPLEGISELPVWYQDREGQLKVNDEALTLALLRQAVDPKLKRKTAGR